MNRLRLAVRRYRRALDRPLTTRSRVAALEAEVQENRQLNRRIAELTDVVAELLVPLAEQGEERAGRTIADYRTSIGQ